MPSIKAKVLILFVAAASFAGCQQVSQEDIATESKKANDYFEKVFNDGLDRSPMFQTMLGIKKNYGDWDDLSDEFAQEQNELTKKELADLRREIDRGLLDAQTRLSYDLFEQQWQDGIENFKYRFHGYPVNQMFGMHSQVPAFLINMHRISEKSDADAYISRLEKVDTLFDQLITDLKTRAEKGIVPPKFVFAHVLRDCNNIITGTTIADDFKNKVEGLSELDQQTRDELMARADAALQSSVVPAYQELVSYLSELETRADDKDGVWKFPEGTNYYNARLKQMTTTELTAQEIHDIGLSEVKRIHGEMDKIRQAVNFEGDLQDFFEFMRNDKRFYYENSDADRERYMAEATDLIEAMKGRLDELFIVKPKADLVVKRVEPFREESAGKAFYQRPAPDGSRPGTYYANMFEMKEMPTYQMEALAYHEGIPGHHMQLAIAQELEEVPKFRKFGGYTAYVEGWGLYSEFIPKEMGLYSDPYSDFGRLAMELWRACRLVVDTGIHYKKWTRQEGIDYYKNNTPNPEGDAVKMVERHIVAAGQATAYKIGMLKILELREKAKQALGDSFDIRQFHEVVLTSGAVPLNVLEEMVSNWVKQAQS